jgi:hypothetical protein
VSIGLMDVVITNYTNQKIRKKKIMLAKIFNIVVGYIVIAIITDLYLIDKHPDILDDVERRHGGKASELQIVMFWPIFWAGYLWAKFHKDF